MVRPLIGGLGGPQALQNNKLLSRRKITKFEKNSNICSHLLSLKNKFIKLGEWEVKGLIMVHTLKNVFIFSFPTLPSELDQV